MNLPEEFDKLDSPKRYPWLFLILLLILIIVIVTYTKETGQKAKGGKTVTTKKNEPSERYVSKNVSADDSSVIKKEQIQVKSNLQPKLRQGTDAAANLKLAQQLEAQGKLKEAREKYLELLPLLKDPRSISECEERLGKINIALLVSKLPMEEKVSYTVQKGDALQKIAKKFGTTDELIMAQNNLKTNEVLRVGEKLTILKGVFTIEISKSRNDLLLKLNGKFFKRYLVGTGKGGKTPTGRFVITTQKEKNPTWWKDNKPIPFGHPDNILGTRWMAIKAVGDTPEVRGYGIHGIWDESSIGKAESAGCIRMRNRDVEELFMLVPPGTEVIIYD